MPWQWAIGVFHDSICCFERYIFIVIKLKQSTWYMILGSIIFGVYAHQNTTAERRYSARLLCVVTYHIIIEISMFGSGILMVNILSFIQYRRNYFVTSLMISEKTLYG